MAAKRKSKRTTPKKPKSVAKKTVAKRKPAPKGRPAAKRTVAPKRKPPATRVPSAAAPKKAPVPTGSRFVWFDLMTRDLRQSQSFYQSLLGWHAREVPVPPPMNSYPILNAGEDFGGIVIAPDPNAPPCWLPYVWVENVDASTERAAQLGGRVLMAPVNIPDVGRYSVIADPTGGIVAPMGFVRPPSAPPERGVMGPVAWCELITDNTEAAGRFYSELFGWRRADMETSGDLAQYHLFKLGERDVAGMGARPANIGSNMWITYFMVNDVDGKTRQAKSAGAHELVPPSDIPNIGRFSWLADPQGAVFALYWGHG